MPEVSNERLAELISDAMDCTKWDAETWRVVNTVTDHDDHMSTEQALALGNLISRQSHSTGVVEALREIAAATDADDPESYRCDDREGCLDTVHSIAANALSTIEVPVHKDAEPVAWRYCTTDINGAEWPWTYTDNQATIEDRKTRGFVVEPLYTHPKEAEVAVTEEMAKRLFEWACDDLLPAYGIEASRFDSELAEACRVGLVAALKNQESDRG